jgi:hypothetical protein
VLFRAPRNHRRNHSHAQFCGLLDGPLHVIELVDRKHQRNGQRGIGLKFGDQVEAHLAVGNGGDLRVVHVASRHHIRIHARLSAQHAHHVFGLRAHDGGGSLIPMLGNPAAACHGGSRKLLLCAV